MNTFLKIVDKIEKIIGNNKAWSTRISTTMRSTFSIQVTQNQSNAYIYEEMTHVRAKEGLVLKHVTC